MGIGFCIFFINGIIMLWIYLSKPCLRWYRGYLSFLAKYRTKWEKSLYWNFWLRYFLEDCLATGICLYCYYFSVNLDFEAEEVDLTVSESSTNTTNSNSTEISLNSTSSLLKNNTAFPKNSTESGPLANLTVGVMNLTRAITNNTLTPLNETEPREVEPA